jgi:hypothetical protein
MKKYFPLISSVDPNDEDIQTWADSNAHDLHGATVEAAYIMALTPSINEITAVQFMWQDEVYADLSLKRDDIPESLHNAINYYVENELYEMAAYAKEILDKINSKTDGKK